MTQLTSKPSGSSSNTVHVFYVRMKPGVIIFSLLAIALAINAIPAQTRKLPTETERFKLASDYSRDHLGLAMVVMKGDQIVFEDYLVDAGKNLPWLLASGTKSFSGVMCAAAIEDKLISGIDEKVSDTISEWKTDPRRSKITIRQLLSLTSGIDAGELLDVPTYADSVLRPAKYDPGTHFEYGPVPFQIFGEVMTRKLKPKNETVMSYLNRRILDPIGLKVSSWRKYGSQPLLPQGANLKAREWIKFGQLLKNRGKWNGKQIIDAKLLDELTVGSKVNPAYGLTFWLNAAGIGPSGSQKQDLAAGNGGNTVAGVGVYMAAGAGNQRLYVIPSQDLVVVRFGAFGGYEDREFLSKLLTGD